MDILKELDLHELNKSKKSKLQKNRNNAKFMQNFKHTRLRVHIVYELHVIKRKCRNLYESRGNRKETRKVRVCPITKQAQERNSDNTLRAMDGF